MKLTKEILILLLLICNLEANSIANTFNSRYKVSKKNKLEKKEDNGTTKTETNENKNVKHEGWFSYIKFSKDSETVPNYLYKNPSFVNQIKYEDVNSERDKAQDIPTENMFWMALTTRSLNIFEKKSELRGSTYDYLKISRILPISRDNLEEGAIGKIKNFTVAHCFDTTEETQRPISVPGTNPEERQLIVWRICSEEPDLLNNLRENMIELKFAQQNSRGEDYATEENIQYDQNNPENPYVRDEEGRYWRIIKDYGECSLLCGGGYKVQQLQCVKNIDGKEIQAYGCQGQAFRKKSCNTQPCPTNEELKKKIDEENQKLNEARKSVKFMPITNKPQRYDRCVIMERDALIVVEKEQNYLQLEMIQKGMVDIKDREVKKIPIRMVMNSKSIVAYTNGNYASPYKTLDLFSTKMRRSATNANQCFVLEDAKGTKAEFCQLDCTKDGASFVQEWSREIGIFQNHCNYERKVDPSELELAEKVNDLKDQLLRKRSQEKKEKSIEKEIKKLNIKREEADMIEIMALNKQKKMEDLLLKEEDDREAEEIVQLNVEMNKERKKTGCLIETLQKKQVAEKLQHVANQAKSSIDNKNNETKKKLEQMKKHLEMTIKFKRAMHLRKVKELKSKIQSIRTDTVKNVRDLNHVGNSANCFIPTKEQEALVEIYCTKAYVDSDEKLVDCRNLDTFCYSCCENEFNEAHLTGRDECYHERCMKA
jgi:hypothetical protein